MADQKTEPNKLQQLKTALRTEHDALTKAYETLHVEAEAKWAEMDAAKAKLTAFRSENGRVLKAIEKDQVVIHEG